MRSNKAKREELNKELERIWNRISDLMDKLVDNGLEAAEYSQAMADLNFWRHRYNMVEAELLLLNVSPSRRTEMTSRNLKSKLV